MKILQIFGAVVAVHLLAFIFIFASPGCQSGPSNVPTPDATVPVESAAAPTSFNANPSPQPSDLSTAPAYSVGGTAGHAAPTRPGSPAAAAIAPVHVTEDVAPVTTYTISKGDSLWSVAKKNHLSVSELAKANNLPTGAALKPGKKLLIPGKPVAAAAPKDSSMASSSAKPVAGGLEKAAAPVNDGVKYTVLPGESLGVIAHKHQISVGELAAVNNITDPSKLRAGQQLIIPGFKAVNTKSNAATTSRSPATSKPATSSPVGSKPATSSPAAASAPVVAPRFEISAPPPGQDLDAGLKDTGAEVPTIKVEDSSAAQPEKK